MANIKAADVAKLRKMTGAGMMDCKKALIEADGDFEKATEILRKKGQAISAKRADREAKEGVIAAITGNGKGVLVALNCETDFVARTEDFINAAEKIAKLAFDKLPENIDKLKEMKLDDGMSVNDEVTNTSGITGEKVELSFYAKLEAPFVGQYVHFDKKSGTIVAFNKQVDEEVAKNIGMQIVAMKPIAVSEDKFPKDVLDKETRLFREEIAEDPTKQKLSEAQIEGIIKGKVNKFLKNNSLLTQEYIREAKTPVKDYLKSVDPELTVLDFIAYSLKG